MDLPILLVSAKDKEAAAYIISEIINSNIKEKTDINDLKCVWKITNKYYTADVLVHALLDGEKLEEALVELVEAHLIYLASDECNETNALDTMERRAQACETAQVRLTVADAACEPPVLASACAAARRELVALRAPADDDDDGERGAARARAALQAHVWPGLQYHGRADLNGAEDSDEEWSEWCEAPAAMDAATVAGSESEQAFYAALASLPGAAAAARRGGRGGGSREERLERAEQLVAAFCRALGTPFD